MSAPSHPHFLLPTYIALFSTLLMWPRLTVYVGQYCDLARQFDPRPSPNTTNGLPNGTVVPPWTAGDMITPTLEKWGKYDLLEHMNKYFKSRFYPGMLPTLFASTACC